MLLGFGVEEGNRSRYNSIDRARRPQARGLSPGSHRALTGLARSPERWFRHDAYSVWRMTQPGEENLAAMS